MAGVHEIQYEDGSDELDRRANVHLFSALKEIIGHAKDLSSDISRLDRGHVQFALDLLDQANKNGLGAKSLIEKYSNCLRQAEEEEDYKEVRMILKDLTSLFATFKTDPLKVMSGFKQVNIQNNKIEDTSGKVTEEDILLEKLKSAKEKKLAT